MSFIGEKHKGVVYAPGYFLNHEECTRKTKEIPQTLATTVANGSKYVPMGTIYPSNDANAIGIVYEDVDVTTGNMPGSVVLQGEVIEDRLAITGNTYSAVTPEGTENPSEEGWYEEDAGVYTLSTDTVVDDNKTYYEVSGVARMSSAAKAALEALGFTFVDETTVTRPY